MLSVLALGMLIAVGAAIEPMAEETRIMHNRNKVRWSNNDGNYDHVVTIFRWFQ